MFDHFLITRFNLRNPQWDFTKNKGSLLTDEWMEDRLELFENFCFPSVIAQKNKNFSWLLYLDETTTPKFKTRLEKLTANYPFIKLFFIDGMGAFQPSIKEHVSEHATKPYLITTRIDNDDCVHVDYIDAIQKSFNKQEYQAIDIIKGFTLQIEPQFILGKKEHVFNPFISLIERNVNPKTVWSNDHTAWKKETNIQQISDRRLWMSIIHEKNKVNEFDGYGKVDWNEISRTFIVSDAINAVITNKIIPFKEWQFKSFRNFMHVKLTLMSKVIKKSIGVYKVK
ncbi:glycosyltransferase [Flavobacterium tegetincola]|uniref:glycosyltransferase n=1 Tax=Flavobacterium tegetincola TaxID=150172 RepID=UPI00041AD450|nr:glycosyltransferase [Flavobacterium tegetincola]